MFGYNISWTAYTANTACNRPQRSFRFVNFWETIERCLHSASVVGPQIGPNLYKNIALRKKARKILTVRRIKMGKLQSFQSKLLLDLCSIGFMAL